MHHEDLTAPVLAGLAWYYLLAAMMNAAAAAYVSYGEMVGPGASRLGLAARTRRMPGWLIGSFFTLYGLAFLARSCSGSRCPGRSRSFTVCVPRPTPFSRSSPVQTPPTSPR